MFHGLTPEICEQAFFDFVFPCIANGAKEGILNKCAGNIVVLDPAISYKSTYDNAINDGSFPNLVLWENAIGDMVKYDLDKYELLARTKAFTSFLTGLPSHLVQQQFPALYVPGMTKWGGSAIAGMGPMKLIVAFSGVQWNFDQMISEMMISAIQALCLEQMREVMANDEPMILAD